MEYDYESALTRLERRVRRALKKLDATRGEMTLSAIREKQHKILDNDSLNKKQVIHFANGGWFCVEWRAGTVPLMSSYGNRDELGASAGEVFFAVPIAQHERFRRFLAQEEDDGEE